MNERSFQFRLRSSHPSPDGATQDLVVEFLGDSGEWETQQLSLTMPGFRIRLDAAASEQERGLADDDAIAYMQERMKLCPISRNLPDGVRKRIDLTSLG